MATNLVDTVMSPLNCVSASYGLTEQRLFCENNKTFPLRFKQSLLSYDALNFDSKFSNILLTTSAENTLRYIDANTLLVLGELTGHNGVVTDVTFAKTSPFIAWSCGLDGSVLSWDLRTNKNEISFQSMDGDKLLSISASLNDEFVCTGAECVEQDEDEVKANLYVWDVKMKDYYQVYTDVFAESIDHCVFHPSTRHLLLTASRDGLVYLCDVREKENEACQYVLNTESGISQIAFYNSKKDSIYCVTDEGAIFLWESQEGNEICKFPNISLPGKSPCDVIDCFFDERSEKLIAAVGSDKGNIDLVVLSEDGSQTPWLCLYGGHQATVRAICWNSTNERIITSCEDGMVSMWRPKICKNGDN